MQLKKITVSFVIIFGTVSFRIAARRCVVVRGGVKDWPLVQWPTRPLPYGPQRPLVKLIKNFITAAKTGFYSFKLFTVDNVEALSE